MHLRLDDFASHVHRARGTPDPEARKLFAIMRDEMAFLPAFLAHYRALGFEQFLIFDDGSSDGTRAHLDAQPDVVTYQSTHRFGDRVTIVFPDESTRNDRFGTWVKAALPHMETPDQVVAYFDADEFLILPPGMTSVADIFAEMDARDINALCASLVEFFPETLDGLAPPMPGTPETLFERYPWFEPEPLVSLVPDAQPDPFGTSKTNRLFDTYGIGKPTPTLKDRLLRRPPKPVFNRSARHKLPFLRRSASSWQIKSHYSSLPPAPDKLLTLAHFVFTADFAGKIDRARHWKAHAQGAAKYDHYATLLDAMRADDGSFLSPQSQRFTHSGQLVEAGLMRW